MAGIARSELIINNRGAIYHLDVRPEEIAPSIILAGDPDRVPAISKHFDHIEFQLNNREFITHTGYIGHKRISVVSTGIGTDNIDIVLNELDALFNVDFETGTVKEQLTSLRFFRVGTSGSLQKDVPVDSLLASTHGLGIDNLLNFYKAANTEAEMELLREFSANLAAGGTLAIPYISAGSSALLALFGGYQHGITVTCPGFYAPQGRVVRAALRDPGMIDRFTAFAWKGRRITNFEMETAGIYGLSNLLGHQAISLNAILANRITGEFTADAKAIVDRLIRETLEIVSGN
ncbi:nucleoside phosphorylase [Hufsiella ginkgonis]|uniref:Uridine phosphorylase n=1 Tax=Hufsiella ginkgonis TaxID=2695274 RepID=A0A7K1Y3W2_9SPHI|nr:nucleoside phosphorylase [Hufsiella ginkgonis]MXV17941.1 phosphorylase [Hufsiella ginkgonis]